MEFINWIINDDIINVEKYINDGVDINKQIGDSYFIILIFSLNKTKIANHLLDIGADVNVVNINTTFDALYYSIINNNNLELTVRLINLNVDINRKYKHDITPLHLAVINNNIEMTKLLLDNGADIDAKDIYDNRPIDIANSRGYRDIIEYLISFDYNDIKQPDI